MDTNKILKNKRVSKIAKNLASVFSALVISGAALSFVACTPNDKNKEDYNNSSATEVTSTLPTYKELNDFFDNYIESDGNNHTWATFSGIDAYGIHRIADTGNPIEIGVDFPVTKVQEKILQATVDEYNELFKVINPNYSFVLNLENPQNSLIEIQLGDKNDVTNSLKNVTDSIDGEEIVHSTITLNKNLYNKSANFNGTLKSLLMKSIGGIEFPAFANSPSIMVHGQTSPYEISKFTKNDLLMLSQLYKNSSVDKKLVDEYIKNAPNSIRHSYDLVSAEMSAKKIFEMGKKLKSDDVDLFFDIKDGYFSEQDFVELKKAIDEQGITRLTSDNAVSFGECVVMKGEISPSDGYKFVQINNDNSNIVTLNYDKRDIWKDLRASTTKKELFCFDGVAVSNGEAFVKFGDYLLQIGYDYDIENDEITDFSFKHFYKKTDMSMQEYFEQTGVVWDNVNKGYLDNIEDGLNGKSSNETEKQK